MSYHGSNQTERDKPRRTQQSRNTNLLNAAWPKPPSVPTRRSHIKAVNHGDFVTSWSEWREHTSTVFEDMDVDMDVDDEISKTLMPVKTTATAVSSSNSSSQKIPEPTTHTLRARRIKSDKSLSTESKTRLTRSSKKKILDKSETSSSKPLHIHTSPLQGTNLCKNKENKALFIVIHANKVEINGIKGPATSPVKVYAKKFMVQMEDEALKKEISFRVSCKTITSLEVSLNKKPFWIKLVSPVQYLSGKTAVKKSKAGHEPETIVLHLTYAEAVPSGIKNDLKELFQVVLADQNLWPKDEEQAESKNYCEEEKKSTEVDAKDIEKKPLNSTQLLPLGKTPIQSTLNSVRKRVPCEAKKKVVEVSSEDDPNQIKVARRSLNSIEESMEEQIKTLSYEAAHYQMLTAQQRMIIQSIEEELKAKTNLYNEAIQNKEEVEKLSLNCNTEISSLLNDIKIERDLVKALESQVESMQNEISEKDNLLAEKNDAIRVRDETILNLRSFNHRNLAKSSDSQAKKVNMEETRQNLMQMQVSRENMSVELELTKQQLQEQRSLVARTQTESRNFQIQSSSISSDLANLRTEFIASQEELVTSREQIRSLTQQLADARVSHEDEIQQVNTELNKTKSQLEDVRSELAESINSLQLSREQLNLEQPKDWILQRGEIILSDNIIGTGAWGNVKAGSFRGTDVAIKQIHLLILSAHNRRLFEREMAIASRCRHPCLVQFIGATNDDGTPLFVMERLNIDLRSLLGQQPLKPKDFLNIGFDVICGVAYLHQSKPVPIIHRDISSSNILLYKVDSHWRGKLSDYGAANFVRLSMTRHPGGLLYSAPEANGVDQTPKLDVYSFGVLFCEMVTRELPVPESRKDQIKSIQNVEYRTLVNNCLRRNITERLDSSQVLACFKSWISSMQESSDLK